MNLPNPQAAVNSEQRQSSLSPQAEPQPQHLPGFGPHPLREPFAPIPRRVIRGMIPQIGRLAFCVYCVLRDTWNEKSWTVTIDRARIARLVDATPRGVSKAILRLEQAGLIGRQSGKARGMASSYYFKSAGGGNGSSQGGGNGSSQEVGTEVPRGVGTGVPTITRPKYHDLKADPPVLPVSNSGTKEPEQVAKKQQERVGTNEQGGNKKAPPPLVRVLSVEGAHDPAGAAARIWQECRKRKPDCSIAEVVAMTETKLAYAFERNWSRPIGYAIATVPYSLKEPDPPPPQREPDPSEPERVPPPPEFRELLDKLSRHTKL